MFNEDGDKIFLEKEDNSPLAWKVIKGTADAYKKAKKLQKKAKKSKKK